jgi:uncharacterized protein (DUF1501 family)
MKRRDFLQGLSAAIAVAGLHAPLAWASGHSRRLVIFYNEGGWDPSFVFDPHFDEDTVEGDPGATPAEINGIAFAHSPMRPSVKAFFQAYGSESLVLNGLRVPSISHTQGARLLLTGRRDLGASDLPTLVAQRHGHQLPMPHLVISGPRFPGGVSGTMVPLSETLTGTVHGELPAHFQAVQGHEQALQDFLALEHQALSPEKPMFERMQAAWAQRTTLDSTFPLRVVQNAAIGDQIDNVVEAFQGGISCCATLRSQLPELVVWDSHSDNSLNQNAAYDASFSQLHTLVDRLSSAGLLSTTTILVASEMGRSPLMNALGGKDHWPFTSAMLVGAGVRGGRVMGASNGQLIGEKVDFATGSQSASGAVLDIANLHAGLLAAFDIDPDLHLPQNAVFTAPFSG